MRKMISGAMLGATMLMAVPALAALPTFTVTLGTLDAIPVVNDFKSNLNAVGLTQITGAGAAVTLSRASTLKFEYMGSESGFVDTFRAGSVGPFSEFDKASWGPVLIGIGQFLGGSFTAPMFTSSGSPVVGTIGTASFGIFLPAGMGAYTSNVLYFGFDDQLNNIDDNHDDFIVRVTAVPEPGSWAMLIVGFGLVGFASRRRGMTHVAA